MGFLKSSVRRACWAATSGVAVSLAGSLQRVAGAGSGVGGQYRCPGQRRAAPAQKCGDRELHQHAWLPACEGRTDTRNLAWTFTVVDSKEVNAFALPGGWVYVNRGLIERATNMSELAGVLGHEIGHVTLRHSVQQMQQAQGANVGVSLLCTLTSVSGDSGAGQAAIGIGEARCSPGSAAPTRPRRSAEAVATTVKAGISPRGIPEMFQLLLKERKSNPGALDASFASHPLEEDRITATEALIALEAASQLQGLTRDTKEFQTFRRRLLALPPSPAPKTP